MPEGNFAARSRALVLIAALAVLSSCGKSSDRMAAACTVDRDCSLGEICEDGRCAAGCRDALDCPGDLPICDTATATGTCVACRGAGDCPDGFDCVERQCRQACRDDGNCASGHCDTGSRWCVDCTEDAHCPAGEVCSDQDCVPGCDDDDRCPTDRPRCVADRGSHGACVECRGDADCADGECSRDGTCVDPDVPDASMPDARPAVVDARSPADAAPDARPSAPALDLLFVIDNSSGMGPLQTDLLNAFPGFLADLEARVGVRPDLHIGVVSTDLGGPAGFGQCGAGDGARLQASARVTSCVPPTGNFLRDVAGGGPGGRDVNYTGDLPTAFRCIARLGINGCGFEQPLAALIRALDGSVPGNAGFLRPGAALAVVIASDEDDCSAASPTLFETDTSRLGPLDSFRCFAQGVRCTPDSPRSVGVKSGCVPRTGNVYMSTPDVYARALSALKPAGRIAVQVIAGPPSPVEVRLDSTTMTVPTLLDSCFDLIEFQSADPAVRLSAFSMEFGTRGVFAGGCMGIDASLRAFGPTVAAALAQP